MLRNTDIVFLLFLLCLALWLKNYLDRTCAISTEQTMLWHDDFTQRIVQSVPRHWPLPSPSPRWPLGNVHVHVFLLFSCSVREYVSEWRTILHCQDCTCPVWLRLILYTSLNIWLYVQSIIFSYEALFRWPTQGWPIRHSATPEYCIIFVF
jgi:hypothetical protein